MSDVEMQALLIAQSEVLSLIESHIALCESREPRFGPESESFTKDKRQHLVTIYNDLAGKWGFGATELGDSNA